MRKVFVVGPDSAIKGMFMRRGWEPVTFIDETIDLIQFTGGEDVDPSYYKETKHPRTYSNPQRDAREAGVYNEWAGVIPMAGICRGGQFLNVMNGGKLWQHVNNHGVHGTHLAYCNIQQSDIQVTSTHHQMMIPTEEASVLMTASLATTRQTATHDIEGLDTDVEAVLYVKTRSLCYQPHPEYVGDTHECRETYFKYLDLFLT